MVSNHSINDYFYARPFLSTPGLTGIEEVINCIANVAFKVVPARGSCLWRGSYSHLIIIHRHSSKLFLDASAIFVVASKIKSCDYFFVCEWMACNCACLVFVELVYPKKITEINRKGNALFLRSCEPACWREGVVTVFG